MARSITVIPAQRRSQRGRKSETGTRKIRVAAYCRVSTDQEEQLNSFENQVEYYTKYINEKAEYQLVDIYADEGISGTNTKKREGFNRMIADCEAGKIDLVITKSISRFARNTQDCLTYSRKLKGLGIGIIFEKENISTMDASGELLFTILSSLAQEESRNISENCKWALRHNYKQGIVHVNTKGFMGYDADKDGNLIINPEQAKIVRRVFREFEEGWTPNEIANHLNEDKVKGVKGRVAWNGATIRGMLRNEKYQGDARLQKTYTTDYLSKKRVKNEGQVEQYYVENSHKPIIARDEWEAVQMELERREGFCKEVGIAHFGNASIKSGFTSKLVCGICGNAYERKCWSNRGEFFWACRMKRPVNGKICNADNVKDEVLRKAFVIAWNAVVKDRDSLLPTWETMKEAGNPLEKMRAKQMIDLTGQGSLACEVHEHTRMVLERIVINSKTHFTVRFLDGTSKEVCITE
ncbi:MAG TPA: recombinase family protein [Lachnospiraceae bacterium]|nr:recombinase family protein [Lachnospiraceae bacterium]